MVTEPPEQKSNKPFIETAVSGSANNVVVKTDVLPMQPLTVVMTAEYVPEVFELIL
jgi:hypothetical protein